MSGRGTRPTARDENLFNHAGRDEHDEKQERKTSATASAAKGEKQKAKKESVIPATSGNPERTLRHAAPHPLIGSPSGWKLQPGFPLSRE
jgi:hypothetical protein